MCVCVSACARAYTTYPQDLLHAAGVVGQADLQRGEDRLILIEKRWRATKHKYRAGNAVGQPPGTERYTADTHFIFPSYWDPFYIKHMPCIGLQSHR